MANIQIHELNDHSGALGRDDYLPTDNGVNTTKIAFTDILGYVGSVISTPLVATTAEEMTDTEKIYVYVGTTTASLTNGHWYYYANSNWNDGGLYNAEAVVTDKTLSISDAPADAKVVGDRLEAIDDDIDGINTELGTKADAEEVEADIEAINTALETKADTDGIYEDMSVGNLISTQFVENKEPYLFRRTGNGKNIDGSEKAFIDKIIGGTVAWNQLVQNGDFANIIGWNYSGAVLSASNNVLTATLTGSSSVEQISKSSAAFAPINGHKYLTLCEVKPSKNTHCRFQYRAIANGIRTDAVTANVWQTVSNIFESIGQNGLLLYFNTSRELDENDTVQFRNFMCTDLTALFGSAEIADYVYSLEQTTKGAGVAWLRDHGFIDGSYRAYDSGSLQSVKTSAHKMVGFNQWDEEWETGIINGVTGQPSANANRIRSKNFIKVLPSTTYYCYFGNATVGISGHFYTADGTYLASDSSVNIKNRTFTTPANAGYMKFNTTSVDLSTYNHDICINISDPSKNRQYEPYELHSYPLDPNLELRGLFKLDANNNLYADGDVYESSGAVSRKYGIRAYQSGDESLTDAITDGTNTVYKLTTTTTETAQPYANQQIVSPLGTEEYIDTRDVPVPVGHETEYMANLRKKIEDLPWDLSMIAPIENGATASQAYSTGQYFIKDNQFCKALTSIASGATFTLNTNYAVTTVANELYTALHS